MADTAVIRISDTSMRNQPGMTGSWFQSASRVVERTHSWLNRFRHLLIRWDKKPDNALGLLHIACGLIAHRAA